MATQITHDCSKKLDLDTGAKKSNHKSAQEELESLLLEQELLEELLVQQDLEHALMEELAIQEDLNNRLSKIVEGDDSEPVEKLRSMVNSTIPASSALAPSTSDLINAIVFWFGCLVHHVSLVHGKSYSSSIARYLVGGQLGDIAL